MTDAAIVEAWERRKAAYDVYNALPFADERRGQVITVGGYTPEEAAQWAIIDAAEDVIRSTVASTPEGVAIQLWTQLSHCCEREDEAAALQRDLTHFEAQGDLLDWTERMTVAALRSLATMR